MSYPKIDWTKPIMHAFGGCEKIPVERLGHFPEKGKFPHLIQVHGSEKSVHWVDDVGFNGSKRIIKNAEEPKPAAAAAPAPVEIDTDRLVVALGRVESAISVLVDELREDRDQKRQDFQALAKVLHNHLEAFRAASKDGHELTALALADLAKAVGERKEVSAAPVVAQPASPLRPVPYYHSGPK